MRKWFLEQIEKLGLESTPLKSNAEINGRFPEYVESENIVFPHELIEDGEWRIVEWLFEKGQVVKPGDAVVALENKRKRFEYETFVGGKLNCFKQVGQKLMVVLLWPKSLELEKTKVQINDAED
ncbi:hypothetical protein [Flagellimonas profundi]|uniref:Lipoyl-binding domain-containing protein n=1 Tax=Flagellimonas profundi TaxID=2915620 RepID=A0ABS3FKB6_9FLAO|nr:hypothetical protein [Allomuricauda profundi]MBO0343478.1 hypothetical protein [Allomuricauda profundi]